MKRKEFIECDPDGYDTEKNSHGLNGLKSRDELLCIINKNIADLEENYNTVREEIITSTRVFQKLVEEHTQKALGNLDKSYEVYSNLFASTREKLKHYPEMGTDENNELLRELNGRCMHTVFYSASKPPFNTDELFSQFRVLINKKILFLPFTPTDLKITDAESGTFTLQWKTDPIQDSVIKECGCDKDVKYHIGIRKHGMGYPFIFSEFVSEKSLTRHFSGVMADTSYDIRVKINCGHNISSGWSDVLLATTPPWSRWCGWRECPSSVEKELKYVVGGEKRRIATKEGTYGSYSTVLCESALPVGSVTNWSIRVLETWCSNGDKILIGVVPSVIDQNNNFNYIEYGWYLNCGSMSLYSGPPQRYNSKKVPQFANTSIAKGSIINVSVNTITHTLSYTINGITAEDVYTNLPTFIHPAVLLFFRGDSVELLTH